MNNKIKLPELLLPAGSLEKLDIAYSYGADAAYCGVPRFSLRARENEFSLADLNTAVEMTHARGKKIYFTVNNIPRNSKIGNFEKYLNEMADLKPDGFIMADPGLIMITREKRPEVEVHISVQANTMNYAAVKFWQKIGATRVILSREISIREAAEIKNEVPDMELEIFVHGAICIAHSGRCYMSNYFKNRDANQGACNNACRDEYKVFVTNPRQNNELMEVTESEEGTFLMNSKDLRAIEFLDEIVKAGIDSIKVEGRTKSEYYVGMISRTYRKALDDLMVGKEFNRQLLFELDKVSSRRYFSGFLSRGMEEKVPQEELEFQNTVEGRSGVGQTQKYAGFVENYDADTGLATFSVRHKIKLGDTIEVFVPGRFTSDSFVVEKLFLKNKPAEVVSGGIGMAQIALPFAAPKKSFFSVVVDEKSLTE